jgi:hypothetical protein
MDAPASHSGHHVSELPQLFKRVARLQRHCGELNSMFLRAVLISVSDTTHETKEITNNPGGTRAGKWMFQSDSTPTGAYVTSIRHGLHGRT